MPEPRNPIIRRAVTRHDKRTVEQVDAHVDARVGALKRRSAVRPVVRISATHVDARIATHDKSLRKSLRTKHPEAPGS